MSENKRYYRKLLKANGLIFLAGEELEIRVKNFSVTGLLVELLPNAHVKSVSDLFKAIKTSALMDIYLEELRLAGEVRMVRAEMADNLMLALEFVHIAYDIEAVFYKRKVYRKALESVGYIALNGLKQKFTTVNVSVDGMMVALEEKIQVTPGLVTAFEFDYLNLLGEIEVIWVEEDPEGGTLLGLQYLTIERSQIKAVPRFSPTQVMPVKTVVKQVGLGS